MIVIDKNLEETYDKSKIALVQRSKYIRMLARVYKQDFFF